MKKVFRFWAKIFILATPKRLDAPAHRLRAAHLARLFPIAAAYVAIFVHMRLIEVYPALIHFSAVVVLLILVPAFIILMWRFHKLKIYFQRKQNTP